MRGKIILLAS